MHGHLQWRKAAIMLSVLISAGCVTYRPEPLDPDDILKRVRETRRSAPGGEVLTLARATDLMREHSPRVREARARYAVEKAVADVKTPLPNPSISIAPTFTDFGELLGSDKYGVEAALGWAVLLGGKRRLTDDLNAIRAEGAFVSVGAVEREEYLALRREFLRLAAAVLVVEARRDLEATAKQSLDIMKRLVEAAQATALDVREFELETYGAEANVVEANEAQFEAMTDLGVRTGVTGDVFRVSGFPGLPSEVPSLQALQDLMIRDHPEIARLRAEYAVTEKELRLEVAHQYPNLDLGATYEREGGVNKWGLGFGIEIPVFDRNQPGIARATARRTEIRTRFETRVNRQLAAIEQAHRRLTVRLRRLDIMRTKVKPAAEQTLELARRTLDSGAADALRFLTVLREQMRLRIEMVEAEMATYAAWSDLEQACGAPLLVFPDEPGKPRTKAGEEKQ